MGPIVEVQGLTKKYGLDTVLDNVSLTLQEGTLVALVGKNGSGKSTLIKLLMRLELATSGHGTVLGRDILKDDPLYNEGIGIVTEEIEYSAPVSMERLAEHISRLYRNWDRETFYYLSSLFNFDLQKNFQTVSRGQRMQFALALACASRPKLLLIDEVTAVLDPRVRLHLMKWLRDYTSDGGTALIATNILTEVQSFADRLLILHKKKIDLDLGPTEIDSRFFKLRRPLGIEHPLFENPDCREVGFNSDGSQNYLVEKRLIESAAGAEKFLDQRGITSEDVFVFYSGKAS